MRMTDYVASNYARFNAHGTNIRDRQIGALKYIQHLASTTKTNITTWDLDHVFAKEDGVFPVDRKKLNQIFFQAAEKYKNVQGAGVGEILTPEFISKMQSAQKDLKEDFVKRAKQERDKMIREAEEHAKQLESSLRRAHQATNKIKLAETHSDFLLDEIKKLAQAGGWDRFKVDGTIFSAVTSTPVVLTHKEKDDGIDHTILLGEYRVFCDLRSFVVTCSPEWDKCPAYLKEVEHRLRFHHPHIGGSGSFCLGSLTKAMSEAQGKQNLVDVFSIADSVLRSYNDDNPYIGLYKFVEIEKEFTGEGSDVQTEVTFEEEQSEPEEEQETLDNFSELLNRCTVFVARYGGNAGLSALVSSHARRIEASGFNSRTYSAIYRLARSIRYAEARESEATFHQTAHEIRAEFERIVAETDNQPQIEYRPSEVASRTLGDFILR